MPTVVCGCGASVTADPGDAVCPACGNVLTVPDGKVAAACACGARLGAPARLAGKSVRCPKCGGAVRVPSAPAPALAARSEPAHAPDDGWRKYARYVLAATLLPLVFLTFSSPEPVEQRIQRMIQEDPGVGEKLASAESEEEVFEAFPGRRIAGALHAHDTWAHWLYALASAGVFWALIWAAFPQGTSTSKDLWVVGIFTGTVGILLLLGLQFVAGATAGWVVTGGGLGTLIFWIIKLIGFSYAAALDPDNGFVLSMLGFTFGVGLCEELCKALPLVWHFRRKATLDLRGATVWGLAAGIGFGVSEGITYSSDMYNGVVGGSVYLVRFVSCVALHAVWSASNAALLWRRQNDLQSAEVWYEWLVSLLKILAITMVLHGAYDTLLKKEHEAVALLVAIASFGWFFWLYARMLREPDAGPDSLPSARWSEIR